jgi:peptide/nickel transport system substrate-binding protein
MTFKRVAVLLVAVMLLAGLVLPVAAQGKSVTIAFDQEPDSLSPMYTTMTFAGYVYQLFLSGAWNFDADLNPNPVMVTEIPSLENGGISEDGSTITMHLRDDLVWSDGEPITAADFVFTYEMFMSDANSPLSRDPYDRMSSVEAADDLTVVVSFPEPYAPWLGMFRYILPEHVLAPVFEADGSLDNAEWNRTLSVGSGPFVFDTWEVGSFIRGVRNDNYFDGAPVLDTIVVTFIPDAEAYLAALKNGDADVGTFIAYSDIPELEETGHLDVDIYASGYNEAWYLNVNPESAHPAMLDVNVRMALAMAFDREQIDNDLLLGYTYPAGTYWENTPYDSPDVAAYPYDPEGAAALLDEAGWVDSDGDGIRDKDGTALSLRYVTNTRGIRMDIQVVEQQAFADLGVELLLDNYPSDIFFNGYADGGPIATGQYDIAQWSASPDGFPDPDTRRFTCAEIPTPDDPAGDNWQGYCNEELDALFVEQASTVDYAARVALFHEIGQMIYDDVVWVGVWYDADTWILDTRISGAAINGATPFWNINQWDVAE